MSGQTLAFDLSVNDSPETSRLFFSHISVTLMAISLYYIGTFFPAGIYFLNSSY